MWIFVFYGACFFIVINHSVKQLTCLQQNTLKTCLTFSFPRLFKYLTHYARHTKITKVKVTKPSDRLFLSRACSCDGQGTICLYLHNVLCCRTSKGVTTLKSVSRNIPLSDITAIFTGHFTLSDHRHKTKWPPLLSGQRPSTAQSNHSQQFIAVV